MLYFLLVSIVSAETNPEAIIIEPLPRVDSQPSLIGHPPCGSSTKGKSHLLSDPGSLNPISWLVKTPSPTGNCTLRLSHGTDYSIYETLLPTDNSANSTGYFPCGRKASSTEFKIVVFPSKIICDLCTLQWIWETEKGTHYQCIDVEISNTVQSSCFGKCLNGGVCVDKECQCVQGYSGQFCQKTAEEAEGVNHLEIFAVFVVLLLLAGILGLVVYWQVHHSQIPRSEELFLKRHMGWCMRGRNEDLERIDRQGTVISEERYKANV
ncbi:unnamed protein product [Blepharisma stoltei]|uniref:EGF-like domain-containing protein n=1 Tax=Blepharisma stoltei TaxID=1481888 RepID=A0AAU9J5S5_9CILI|nr:unnamed protein product [Blepharisma stoltei]